MSPLEPHSFRVAAFYRFTPVSGIETLCRDLRTLGASLGVCGTVLIAPEGVNGTIAAAPEALDAIVARLDALFGIRAGEIKFSDASDKPFRRLKVRAKKEIITMRRPEADPCRRTGVHVAPEDWNRLIEQENILLLDTRNDYEVAIGTFRGAVNPDIRCFTEFVDYVEKHLSPETTPRIAMFCTGGIRCEKASSYMLSRGFEQVYQLKGGILQYLEEIPEAQSQWEGSCFVFDRRVGIGHGLKESGHALCYGCRMPLCGEETQSPHYEAGVSCPHCHTQLTPERKAALRMRHRQTEARPEKTG